LSNQSKQGKLLDTPPLHADTAIISQEEALLSTPTTMSSTTLRSKRKSPYAQGDEWAWAKTRLPPHMIGLLARADEFVADAIEFNVEFSEHLRAEANRDGAEVGKCSLEVCGTK
jgi:hypothetical protein